MDASAQGVSVRVLANMVAGVAAESTEHSLDEMNATGSENGPLGRPGSGRMALVARGRTMNAGCEGGGVS